MADLAFASSRDWKQAALKGARNRCPACGQAHLFAHALRPFDACPACREDWTPQRADDFPAYLVILILGHILVPIVVAANMRWDMPQGAQMIAWPALAAVIAVLMIRPMKGAVIGAQWAMRMGGFAVKKAETPAV
jgi:uncharacterized protein (DUF983 family)